MGECKWFVISIVASAVLYLILGIAAGKKERGDG